jgi:hypothetical protein
MHSSAAAVWMDGDNMMSAVQCAEANGHKPWYTGGALHERRGGGVPVWARAAP